jgi:hypothetical protein
MNDNKDLKLGTLKEYRLSWAGKLFFAGVAAKLLGKVIQRKSGGLSEQDLNPEINSSEDPSSLFPFKLQGTPEQLQAVMEVIKATKDFQDEVNREGATVETVMQKLNIQNLAKKAFEERTGKPWPL